MPIKGYCYLSICCIFAGVEQRSGNMDKRNRLIRSNRHLLYVLTAVAVMLTVYSLPKQRSERYSYSAGKPWKYDMLIAPFSFSIEKDDMTLKAEKDSTVRNFAPYFSKDLTVGRSVADELERLYADSLKHLADGQTWHSLMANVSKVYELGIISRSDRNVVQDWRYVTVNSGNVSARMACDSLMGTRDAYRFITSALMDSDEGALLSALNIQDFIRPNLVYEKELSDSVLKERLESISPYAGMVMADQKIVDQGEMVDLKTSQAIRSYLDIVNAKVSSKRFQLLTWGGQSLFVIGCFLFLMVYLMLYRIDDIENRNVLFFLFSLVTLFNVGVGLYMQYAPWTVMLVPCTVLAIMLRIFLDSRTAFAGYLVFVMTTSVCVTLPYEYVLLQVAAGMAGIYSLKELSQRSQILRTCLIIFLTYSIVWFSLQIIKVEDFKEIETGIFLFFALNSILVLLVYPLLFLIEKLFGFTSNVTLIELSNINNPLLRELAEKAPGTFQHSMQVSTLAAEAATAIKANSQLVRTAALYHDIGKIGSAPFFTENQNGVNPHDRLTPQQSARIITDHVDAGLALADKFGLPAAIREFIATHHGCGMARYFYLKFKQEHPDMEPDIQTFSYPGPNPSSKETAILMMADAAEAASRSLKEYTEESISEMVDRIIDRQVSDGFFHNCPISWQEIGKIKETFKEKLRIMYHTRISYPDDTTAGQRQTKP